MCQDGVHQLLHPRRLEAHPGAGSAVPPAAPRLRRVRVVVGKRLVEQVEDHRVVATVGSGNLAPEFRRVVAIRHRRLTERDRGPSGAPVQLEDHDQSGTIQASDEVADRLMISGT
jgi:hypothetical protein